MFRTLFLPLLILLLPGSAAMACITLPTITAEEIQQLTKTANGGDLAAMEKLAMMYEVGNYAGGKQDFKEAVKWWKKAADKGDAEAERQLAEKYDQGRGAARDEKEALKLYLSAANHGDFDAQLHMRVIYEFGTATEKKDPFKAYTWYLIAEKSRERLHLPPHNAGAPDFLLQLTPEQVAEATRLAQEWKPQDQPPKAAVTVTGPGGDCKG